MAFEGGRGRTAVPVRSGLRGAVFGVAGLVAAVVFAASLTALLDTPSRYGWNWSVSVPGEYEDALLGTHAEALTADPTVARLATVRTSRVEMGGTEVLAHGIGPLKGSVGTTVTDGRPARGPDEVVLGDDTMARLGVGLGDRVEAKGTEGPIWLRVVGRGPIPFLDTDSVADGAMMTREGVERLATAYWYSDLVLDWVPGTDEGTAQRRLQEEVGPVFVNRPPAGVINLDRVEALPRALAAFLALLAVLAVAHTLVTTVRARRRDLAVLKVLGFERRQVSATVAWQSTLLALAGLFVGLPLGVAGGGWAWATVARGLGVVDRATIPIAGLAIVGTLALLVANVVAALPARRAARTSPALALRAE
jgi:putative ABC transport system permease protein